MAKDSGSDRALIPDRGEREGEAGAIWRIREAKREDLDRLYELEVRAHQAPWPREAFEEEFQRENGGIWVVDGEECLAAMVLFWRVLDELEILDVAVAPRYQGMGLGTWLMHSVGVVAAASGVQRIVLEVRISNREAIGLYQKLGFIRAGRRPDYYEDNGEDAYIMVWELGDEVMGKVDPRK